MKKIFVLSFIMGFCFVAFLFGQDTLVKPDNWGDVITNPQRWFIDFAAVAGLTAFVATFFNGILKVVGKWPRQLVAWAVAILLLIGSDLLNFGYAAQYPIYLAAIHGFAAGLASNGTYNIPWIKGILDWIEKLLNKEKQ